MDTDDLEPPTRKPGQKDLDVMSIEALGDYIAELEAEISRVRTVIESKQGARTGAEEFFKS
jgi:uncharacterized small protein (DUF1192 family)